jgi:diadenosine tetraphosphatase ApaH/serine/threonine PP2A family protein phosphatase
VSDVHGNLPALCTVLDDLGSVDRLVCLGDFVGYGPWPNECVALLREHDVTSIAGNHDLAAIGALPTDEFNPDAAYAAAWTTDQLDDETRRYLESLAPFAETEGITLAHGSPREPVWEYLLSLETAAASFGRFTTQLCLVGHSHVPCLFVQDPREGIGGTYAEPGSRYSLGAGRCIANPGSVGQPRDRDPRAAYAVYDSEQAVLEWHRVDYDIAATQRRMREVGLPRYLIDRLSQGA